MMRLCDVDYFGHVSMMMFWNAGVQQEGERQIVA